MPIGLVILWTVLLLASVAVLVYWSVGLGRIGHTRRNFPTARAGIAMAVARPPSGPVCVIVPAHNEEHAIQPLLESLLAQDYPDLRVLLCLDRCTDDTAGIVQRTVGGDSRFRILTITDCPEDWAGKVNAAWTGATAPEAAEAEYLLFVDADTALDPSCIRATVALMEHREIHLLSLLSTLTTDRWFEWLVQPAAGLELIRQYPIARANRPERRRAFANGQFMLFRREAYQAVGGHEAVHSELLEDIALARRMAEARRPAGLFLADGMVRCRMYESWETFQRGWKRIYTEAARCKVRRLRQAALAAGLMGSLLPMLAVCQIVLSAFFLARGNTIPGTIGVAVGGLALVAFASVILATYRIGRIPLAAAPGFVVGSWMISRILREAAADLDRQRPVSWGGRSYVRVPRN
jgi:cellulose synthase/poly-beta-1,6-N-acetylglucosamine synthase-like glycosyltransferase